MYSIFYTIGMVFLWVINLFNGTGLGVAYQTTERTMLLTVLVAMCCLAYRMMQDGDILIKPRYFYVLLPMVMIFVGSSFVNGQRLQGLDGFWVYLLVYILSFTKPDIKTLRLTAIAYGVLGLVILYIYAYMDALDGWNGNSIGIIGLFSFLVFTIPFFGMRGWRSYVIMPLVGVAYVILIQPTDSRSCMIVVAITLLFVLRLIPVKKLLKSSKGLFGILLVPLGIAIFVCLVALFADISGLMEWSKETFNKELFSGRDQMWISAFQGIWKNFWLGTGNINVGSGWHNSAISCISAFGVLGFIFWIKLFHEILKTGIPYTEDTSVSGAMVAFLLLYCHQSVELGIFSSTPSLLPYVILGILLGRVNYLKRRELR